MTSPRHTSITDCASLPNGPGLRSASASRRPSRTSSSAVGERRLAARARPPATARASAATTRRAMAPAHAWLSESVQGYCALTTTGDEGDCSGGHSGSFTLEPVASVRDRADNVTVWELLIEACLQRCAQCARCRYISASLAFSDCSWAYHCGAKRLRRDVPDFRSGAARSGVPAIIQSPDEWHPPSCQQLRRAMLRAPNQARGGGGCQVSRTYHPSGLERSWWDRLDSLVDLGSWRRGCEMLKADALVRDWLRYWRRRERHSSPRGWNTSLFSYHVLTDCHGKTIHVPIEPLIGLLRHPRYHCFAPPDVRRADADGAGATNKDYMLPAWSNELMPELGRASRHRAFFFDLGASTYDAGLGGSSQRWFIEAYEQRGISFSRILAWEAQPTPAAAVVGATPIRVLDRLSYYNVPVDPAPGAKANPLRVLKALGSVEDFIVLKIDIDAPSVEESLLVQILEDDELAALIDELYFEHHVHLSPMRKWWSTGLSGTGCAVHDSYALFRALRARGIRAHSWV